MKCAALPLLVLLTTVVRVACAQQHDAHRPLDGHAMHDNDWHGLFTVDRIEFSTPGHDVALAWEVEAWTGTDVNRLWLRSDGERSEGDTEHASVELLAGRSVTPWWDIVAGLRHDFGVPATRDFLAAGIQGLAPYWIELAATAYLGEDSRTAVRIELGHDLLITNRLILQSHLQADAWGKDDVPNAIAAGPSMLEAGLRMRFEFTRRFAPYIGLSHQRALADTARLHRRLGMPVAETQWVAGLRTWF